MNFRLRKIRLADVLTLPAFLPVFMSFLFSCLISPLPSQNPCFRPLSSYLNESIMALDNTTDVIEVEGKVITILPGTMFRVELDNSKHVVLAHISGKMRKRFIRLTPGDRVKMEMSQHDFTKARIVYRLDSRSSPARSVV